MTIAQEIEKLERLLVQVELQLSWLKRLLNIPTTEEHVMGRLSELRLAALERQRRHYEEEQRQMGAELQDLVGDEYEIDGRF